MLSHLACKRTAIRTDSKQSYNRQNQRLQAQRFDRFMSTCACIWTTAVSRLRRVSKSKLVELHIGVGLAYLSMDPATERPNGVDDTPTEWFGASQGSLPADDPMPC
jgi:hypothetical protein